MRYFFGLPPTYNYNFLDNRDGVLAALTRLLGYKVGFLCNSYGGIYNGDVYYIDQEITEEEYCFLKITHGFDKVDTDKAEHYIYGKPR